MALSKYDEAERTLNNALKLLKTVAPEGGIVIDTIDVPGRSSTKTANEIDASKTCLAGVIYTLLGNAYKRQERPSEAIDAFQRAIQLAPFLMEAYDGLGELRT